MTEIEKKKIEQEILHINTILMRAKECFNIAVYLSTEDVDDRITYQKNMDSFFVWCRLNHWRIAVIELVKLFYYNTKDKTKTEIREDFNIRHLLKKLKQDELFSKLGISTSVISTWTKKLDGHDDLVKNLMVQRDKLYAHEDRNLTDRMIKNTPFPEINDLILIGVDIVKTVYKESSSGAISMDFVNSPALSLEYIVRAKAKVDLEEVKERKKINMRQ